MKKTIRLSERDLHKLIGESVKRILSEGNAWADQQPVDKNNPDWWYYRQEIEPDEVEDFGDEPIGESKLRNIVRESIKRVVNEELSDKVKRSMQMASDWIDVDINNRMLTDFTPDMYSPNYRGNNNVYDLSNDVSPLGHKRHEEMNDAWGEHERNESKIRNIVRESIKKVVNESYLYTKDINTDDLHINGHWTEDGYAEWEATVDNGWYTLRGTYDGHNCELEEIIEGHSGHSVQHSIDDDTIDWFNQNICDIVKSWLDKYAEDYSEWHSNMYGDE